ncbi:4-hydroxy-tetrahydrodipicolinate synthase [Aeromicrobium fastidiosum]|uniref:4-hydroxy-tetrahydrodipicolinate synthase n=1 Tax=Aeromicrobium fastidiosum TaxID=52699 RepID=A0A641ANV4_9ACTN|nr:4-hydroxy-tetrahydrodipicolinate synthase [Aeromicrobium fastidiosum]KAA1376482.1 4-hydroxy-tetrahydrodipicolinate synthase [Aeromicrobium fastidiosum]MBP2391601.1 4-hydroxy-tetrahydrodipicolinate synthase [Aeromicrobium fastidiosum]
MTSPLASEAAPFGRVLTAMVTPFTVDGELDLDAAQKVASHLVDHGNDGLVVSGTTGESPTTTVEEDGRLLAAVLEAVGDRATVVAGVGTNDTRHSVELAEQAKKHGAHGLLIVTPYYSKPPQSGILHHFTEVARAGDDTPVMLYDIPGRSGVQIADETYVAMADNPLIVAMKDAVGDLDRGAWLMAETGIAIYSGDDPLNLAWLAMGAAGVVSVVSHAAGRQYAEMVAAVDAGDLTTARAVNLRLQPAVRALMNHTQGAITAKAAMQLLGVLDNRTMRAPLLAASEEEVAIVRDGLVAAGLLEQH